MGNRKYAVMIITLLIFACFNLGAHAAEPRARYLVEGTYNAEQQTYTVEIYLETDTYLAAGTFGMKYNENITIPEVNINTEYFERLDAKPFENNAETFTNNHQLVFQWGMNEAVTDKIKLADFTLENISQETAESWGDEPFALLDWMTTDLSKTDNFTRTGDYDVSLNREIWRVDGDSGFYQGYAYDDGDEWIDIGFKFTSNLNQVTITGTVTAYNPKNNPTITAYGGDNSYDGEITQKTIHPDGKVDYTYEIAVKNKGDYTLIIEKSAHLTYAAELTISESEYDAGAVTLLCGDINGDGYIKLPDRENLIRFLNRQKPTTNTTQFDLADLNGDEKVNLFDLNILKTNLNKTYK